MRDVTGVSKAYQRVSGYIKNKLRLPLKCTVVVAKACINTSYYAFHNNRELLDLSPGRHSYLTTAWGTGAWGWRC